MQSIPRRTPQVSTLINVVLAFVFFLGMGFTTAVAQPVLVVVFLVGFCLPIAINGSDLPVLGEVRCCCVCHAVVGSFEGTIAGFLSRLTRAQYAWQVTPLPLRGTTYALSNFVVNTVGAFGSLLSGLLAEKVFGYEERSGMVGKGWWWGGKGVVEVAWEQVVVVVVVAHLKLAEMRLAVFSRACHQTAVWL